VILLFIVLTSFRTSREAARSGTSRLWREILGSRMRARNRRWLFSSLRGALATKQSSLFQQSHFWIALLRSQ